MLTRRRFIQAGLTVALGSILTGYGGYRLSASLQGTREALAALRASRTPLALLEGYREFRGVIHAHTRLSHDSHGTPAEILSAASDAKLNFLVTTDHYTPDIFTEGMQGLQENVVVTRGVEAPLGCTRDRGLGRRCGAVLAFGLRDPFNPDAFGRGKPLFDAIHDQGALAIIAHPRGAPDAAYFEWADGMEIYDIADIMRDRLVEVPRYLLDFLLAHAEYQDELFVSIFERLNWHLLQWDRLTRMRRFVGIAGNDALQNLAIFGLHVDPYPLIFRALNTHIVVPTETSEALVILDPPLSEGRLLAALRAGRVFSSFNLLADASGFHFVARRGDAGQILGVIGDQVGMQEGTVLIVRSPVPGELVLLRDGFPVSRTVGRSLSYAVDRPGVYRVEVSLRVMDRWRPWIFANPIYVRG